MILTSSNLVDKVTELGCKYHGSQLNKSQDDIERLCSRD